MANSLEIISAGKPYINNNWKIAIGLLDTELQAATISVAALNAFTGSAGAGSGEKG